MKKKRPADLFIAWCFLVAHNFHENRFVLTEFSRKIERRGGSQTSSSSPAEGISTTDICQAIDQIVREDFFACSSEFGWPEKVKFPRNKYPRACAWGSWKIFLLLWKGTEVRCSRIWSSTAKQYPGHTLVYWRLTMMGTCWSPNEEPFFFGHRRIQHIFWLNPCRGLTIVCYVHHEILVLSIIIILVSFLLITEHLGFAIAHSSPMGTVRCFFPSGFRCHALHLHLGIWEPPGLVRLVPGTSEQQISGDRSWGDMCWDYRTTFNQQSG